ncbi:BTB/POZ domain-containing protein Btb3 [Tirmania nivea]|nr:BTB/POZ domain-containing protein Btb3 [Tirmania nivea]
MEVPSSTVPFKAQIITHLFTEREHDENSKIRAINPVDESDAFKELCEACRRGDVKTVRKLIQFGGVNLNAVDKFDYPPLTLASLCGHYDVVQLLLESGALCERDTFQGERCLYSALTDNIRNLLLQYDFSKSIDEKQPFASHLSSLLTLTPIDTSDITVTTTYHSDALPNSSDTPIYTKEFHLHRFLLCARSQYFSRKLLPSEGKKSPHSLRLPTSIDSRAFESTVRFLYLGEITELFSPEVLINIEKISTHLGLPSLWEFALASHDPKQRRLKQMDEVDKAQEDLDAWFTKYVFEKAVRVPRKEADEVSMEFAKDTFADVILRADEDPEDQQLGAGRHWKPQAVFYPVHKAMLRSEFFTIMFTSSFREGQRRHLDEPLQIIPLEIAPRVLESVLRFFYSDKVVVPLEYALDTLYAADQLFIERLKNKVTMIISTQGNGGLPGDNAKDDKNSVEGDGSTGPYDIYDVIRAGWATRQPKLEEFGAKYIAERLEDYIDDPEFSDIVQESAERIKSRQETDTIELIDDIRYYLDQRFRMRMDDLAAEEMYDEEPIPTPSPKTEAGKGGDANDANSTTGEAKIPEEEPKYPTQVWTEEEIQADFMRAEALKFDELLRRIDLLLEKLKLDA